MMPATRTPETAKAWTATPEGLQELDEWAHEFVMGESFFEVYGKEFCEACGAYQPTPPGFTRPYTTDANASDLVRDRVAMLGHPASGEWLFELADLLADAEPATHEYLMEKAVLYARPLHYCQAAWLLGDEVWAELNKGVTT